jgi:predicted  nucleic acid-binding Zn-ribbon protein
VVAREATADNDDVEDKDEDEDDTDEDEDEEDREDEEEANRGDADEETAEVACAGTTEEPRECPTIVRCAFSFFNIVIHDSSMPSICVSRRSYAESVERTRVFVSGVCGLVAAGAG